MRSPAIKVNSFPPSQSAPEMQDNIQVCWISLIDFDIHYARDIFNSSCSYYYKEKQSLLRTELNTHSQNEMAVFSLHMP